ncbi:probable tRNA N6-adenosine threonylcarbamoyltransferase, mitochondrial isoform X1 [Scyliorhinus canicula]|uniref:probable tRNA N6-adenosine threonylcarbamoyltransferase, mitochondrial isoform X1 n=1 Tax=Scyliorhinus canicula TaxID=7830 RepID=UPI0018F5DC20|nr:probable tRNA N6-adenosine threonylcarbamoyltransferase, mitochondrial isoform X1 [Scyliorhinus canicula]
MATHCLGSRALSRVPGARFLSQARCKARLVLGIETSCDDTGAAVVDETGKILGEALHSQKGIHLETGGIIPKVAQRLHKEHIEIVVQEAVDNSGISPCELTAIATTIKPGLALSLQVGLEYSLKLIDQYKKPFIPIHHMEAHALTVRMLDMVEFPFLVLLISGGHSLLAIARGVSDFLLLGQTLDEAPGDTLDKVARRLSLKNHPACCTMSGGEAIECLAKMGNRLHVSLTQPISRHLDCDFSFSGLRNQVNQIIIKKEREEGIQEGQILSCVCDIAAAVQHTVAAHLAKRTHRAILFCKKEGLLPHPNPALVVSGGVASNEYIRKALQIVTEANGFSLHYPPPKLCTDNGIMIAWNGIEKLRAGIDVVHKPEGIRYEPKAPLGINFSEQVKKAALKVPYLKLNI